MFLLLPFEDSTVSSPPWELQLSSRILVYPASSLLGRTHELQSLATWHSNLYTHSCYKHSSVKHMFSPYEPACFTGSWSCTQRHLPIIEKMKHVIVKTHKWTLNFKTNSLIQGLPSCCEGTDPRHVILSITTILLWSFFLGEGSNTSKSCTLWGPPVPANLKSLLACYCHLAAVSFWLLEL